MSEDASDLSSAVVAELRTLLSSRWDGLYVMHIPFDRVLVKSVCCGNVKWKWKSKAGLLYIPVHGPACERNERNKATMRV